MLNLFKVIKYQLYLLQLENYELLRFFKLLIKKGLLPKGAQRKELVWTMKALLVFGLTELIILGLSFWTARLLFLNVLENTVAVAIVGLGVFNILQFFGFVFLSLSTILLSPADWLVKQVIIKRAQFKIKRLKDLKIIGIAGSYGKTTMKEVLGSVLSAKYRALSTPESVNTPVGIARWVLKNFSDSSLPLTRPSDGHPLPNGEGNIEVAIVEMGEHYRGDVEEICNIAKPDIAVVTGINEAHLERMKTLENITDTVFEVVSKSKAGALIVLNGDDKNVEGNYKNYIWPDHKLEFYGKNSSKSKFQISNFKFDTEKLGWDATIDGGGKIFINLLGEYALGDVVAAIKIAESLGMSKEEILAGIAKIKPVEHRLQPIKSAGGVLVIDDAYNGNPAGVAEAIKVLSRFANRRKLFITPGLVETGKAAADIHRKIGEQLAGVADVVILIRNSVTGCIEEGINQSVIARSQTTKQSHQEQEIATPSDAIGLAMTKVLWFETAQEAHSSLPKILQPGDVIVFQNDWGDQYI